MNDLKPRPPGGLAPLAWHFFLTSRPYSYASELSRAMVFGVLLTGDAAHAPRWMALTLLMWLSFNWMSDAIQGDPGRVRAPWWLWATPLALALALAWSTGGTAGAVGVLAYEATIGFYAIKAIQPWIGPIGPVLRGVTMFGMLAMIAGSEATWPSATTALFTAMIAVLHIMRNLVGDVRDIRTDHYEFPKRFGAASTLWVLRGLGLVAVAIFVALGPKVVPSSAAVSMALCWLVIEVLAWHYGSRRSYLWGYVGHRVLILWTTLFHLLILYPLGVAPGWLVFLAVLALALQPTYGLLPGKRYPTPAELLAARG